MLIKARFCILVWLLPVLFSCTSAETKQLPQTNSNEVIYHVFLRSFYDSDSDSHGDLKGLQQKLDYLQDLGVTAILVLPLQSSEFYHNYFSGDFEKVDPEFGDEKIFADLLKDIHRRGMKFYLDMETQYVTEDHIWWKDSYGNPSSKYSDYIIYNGKGNTDPEPVIFNLKELPGYDGVKRKVATVNMHSKEVLEYNYSLFKHWMDINGDGKFDDGVDGFRLDHAMDDLDWKKKFTGLLEGFWKPLLARLKQVNPQVTFLAEQAYGSFGGFAKEYFEKAGVDRVFAFKLQTAFFSFDKNKLATMADSTFLETPPGKEQVVFLENHDMTRSATIFENNLAKQKIAAALNLLIGGVPSIYYGQELGMTGKKAFGTYGMTDANDIPVREAFEWYKDDSSKGMALWYKNSGPWWRDTNLRPNDGLSLEEQKDDPQSMYNFYKQLLALRKSNSVCSEGKYQPAHNNNPHVYSFLRTSGKDKVLVVINLSPDTQNAVVDLAKAGISKKVKQSLLYSTEKEPPQEVESSFSPYAIHIWKMKEPE